VPEQSIQDFIRAEAKKAGVPEDFALAIAEQESGFDPTAVGPEIKAGRAKGQKAVGIFQFIPSTAAQYGIDPKDPVQNVQGGVRYLRDLFDRHQGDLNSILKEYGGVVTNTTYVPQVLERMKKFSTPAPAAAQPATPGGAPVIPPKSWETPVPGTGQAAGQVGTPPPKPGFFQGVKETLLPFQSWDEAKQFGSAVVSDPLGTAASLGKGILAESGEQLGKAKQAAQTAIGAPPGSALQIASAIEAPARVATAVPIVGPMVARIGEAFGRGETAYGLGQAAGAAAPLAAGKALRGVRPVKPTGPIPLTRGERTGSAVSKFAETLTEKTVPGRARFQAFRQQQQEALISATRDAIEKVATVTGSPGESYRVGQRALSALDEARENFTAPIKADYGRIEEVTATELKRRPRVDMVPSEAGLVDEFGKPVSVPKRTMEKVEVGGLQPETRSLKQFAIPLLRRVRDEAKLVDPAQLKPTVDALTRIVSAPKRLSYQAFQDTRSDLLAIARRHGDPIPGKAGGLAKKLAALTDEAMETAAVGSKIQIDGVPLQQFVRQTNKLWAEGQDAFNQSVLKKMAEEAPERLHLLLERATLDDLATVKKFLPPRRQADLKAQLLDKWLRGDVQGEAVVAGVQGLPEATAGATMRGGDFRKAIERFGRDRTLALFGPDTTKELLSLAKVAEQLGKGKGEAAAGLIAGGINASLLTAGPVAMAAAAFGNFAAAGGTLAGAAASGVAFNIAARLMTNPQGMRGLRRYLSALGTGRIGEIQAAAVALSDIYGRQEAKDNEPEVGSPPPGIPPSRARGAGPVGAPPPPL